VSVLQNQYARCSLKYVNLNYAARNSFATFLINCTLTIILISFYPEEHPYCIKFKAKQANNVYKLKLMSHHEQSLNYDHSLARFGENNPGWN
jgi:hypothetical protein